MYSAWPLFPAAVIIAETAKQGTPQTKTVYMESHYKALMGKLTSFAIIYLFFEIT